MSLLSQVLQTPVAMGFCREYAVTWSELGPTLERQKMNEQKETMKENKAGIKSLELKVENGL